MAYAENFHVGGFKVPKFFLSLVVLRKYVFSLRKVEKDRSLVHVVTGRVKNIWSNVKMFGKASKQHDLIQPNTSVGLSLAFRRDSFLYHNLNSGTNSSRGFVKSSL